MKRILLLFIFSLLISCEDIIYPDLVTNDPMLVVDAWVNNLEEEQIIKLSKTQGYLNNASPISALGAEVNVLDGDGNIFSFQDMGDGNYIWTPTNDFRTLGDIGTEFYLSITYDGKNIISSSSLNRTSTIDSVNFVRGQIPSGSYYAEFWSREEKGVGDAYWIKAYKNGERLATSQDIITCLDAGASSEGAIIDGIPFIPPIRRSITRFEQDDENNLLSPYEKGDSLYVEIHSITYEAFDFLNKVSIQINRPGGFSELFAVSLSNSPTNLVVSNDSSYPVVGFFCISAVDGHGNVLDDVEIEKIERYGREW